MAMGRGGCAGGRELTDDGDGVGEQRLEHGRVVVLRGRRLRHLGPVGVDQSKYGCLLSLVLALDISEGEVQQRLTGGAACV